MAGKPMIHITWDSTGMFMWLGAVRPIKNVTTNIFECPMSPRMRLPVSWFGGLVDENSCRTFDPEIICQEKRRGHSDIEQNEEVLQAV